MLQLISLRSIISRLYFENEQNDEKWQSRKFKVLHTIITTVIVFSQALHQSTYYLITGDNNYKNLKGKVFSILMNSLQKLEVC